MSRLLAGANGTEYFLASLVALPLIERVGRRKLMIAGALIMSISMAVVAGTVSTGVQDADGNIVLADGPGIAGAVFLFVFNTGFALGFLGLTWLYPAEVTPLRIRIQANALSTSVNWGVNFLIVMIVPPGLANIGYQLCELVGGELSERLVRRASMADPLFPFCFFSLATTDIIFAVFNAAIIPCIYFYFPETKGRSLEELDVIFANSYHEKTGIVKEARETPKLYGEELDAEMARLFPDASSQSDSNPEKGLHQRFARGQEEMESRV